MSKDESYLIQGYIAYLNESGIDVTVKYPAVDIYTVSAVKQVGNNIQHVELSTVNLLEGMSKLVRNIENNSASWCKPATY